MPAKKDKKDKKSKEAEKKARKAQKQDKKASKTEKKQKAKGKEEVDSDEESVDLDAVLAEYARQQELFLKITEEPSEAPTARASATILASPTNTDELFVYGGENFDGLTAQFYNDLFVYNIKRDEWKVVRSPNSPLPRSGHCWCRGGNVAAVYLFGGEFSSPKQGTFYHYNDFWKLDPSSREWTRIEPKGKGSSPPARSGARMTYFKNYIILFGGFQDTSQQTKYLNDLWIYDCSTFTWHEPKLPAGTGKPDARSSFSLLPHESGAVLHGGYARIKASASFGPNKGKGASRPGGSKVVLKPMVYDDTWFLRIQQPAPDAPANSLPVVKWERRKKPANAPNPTRAGATMCAHKGRGVLFGGVHDVEESEEGIDSEFFNMLFVWNVDRNRFVLLTLRRPKVGQKKAAPERSRRERGKQAEEDLLRNLRELELKGTIDADSEHADVPVSVAEPDDEPAKVEKPVTFEMPEPRFNAQLTVQDDVLYIFGGTQEQGDKEFTFDEMWAIDLNKLDGVKEIYRRELQDWKEAHEDEDSEEDDEEEEDDAEEEEDAEEPETPVVTEPGMPMESTVDEVEIEEQSPLSDGLPYPRPFETLRAFYERTRTEWQQIVLDALTKSGMESSLTVKEISSKAFDRAEEKWWDCREEIRVLEDEQTEAGIGEVVALEERGGAGAGKRR